MYQNVGEINPSVKIHRCWIENNGVSILNLTSIAAIDISIQDTISFDFSNNFVSKNRGAMLFEARTRTIATALTGNITNNVFAYTSNGEALNMSGHHFQRVYVFNNYFFNNTAGDYRDVVHVQNVVVNFTYNTLMSNKGFHILSAYNTENINTAASQLYTRNGFQDNNATALFRATVFVGSGKPRFHYNYLLNPLNDFELETNRKIV